jgi:transcriptional regulator with GAF, ATPase, and Fis domain
MVKSRTQDATRTSEEESSVVREGLPWCLRLLASPGGEPAAHEVVLRNELNVGRRPSREPAWRLDDPQLSRDHFSLYRVGAGWLLQDLGSKNGTFLDGRRASTAARLEEGTLIRAGGLVCELARQEVPIPGDLEDPLLIGRSNALRRVLHTIHAVARTGIGVLVTGPTGAGKDLVAQRIHALSGRPGELVALNCAAIPRDLFESCLFGHRRGAFTGAITDSPGYFAQADQGTLLLDEVGELPLEMQPKLLRVLDSGEFQPLGTTTVRRANVRVVAATNADLGAALGRGDFRRDLYARLAGCRIVVPPLIGRRVDIPILARALLARARPGWNGELAAPLVERLVLHPWPLNVRELAACMRRVALAAPDTECLGLTHLPLDLFDGMEGLEGSPVPSARPDSSSKEPTREALMELLEKHAGNVTQVASQLGCGRTQLYRWLRYHDLPPGGFR